MTDPRQPKGNHTWDIFIQYHRCPKCGTILESRFDYEKHRGEKHKDVECIQCGNRFTVTKKTKPTFGPLWG